MARFKDRSEYFTRHLFGAGLECPVKLHYYREDYPQNQQSRPFIEHAIYNNRLLTALVRSTYSNGIFVDQEQVDKAADKTHQLLQSEEVVLFDAVFEHQNMMARLPIVHKKSEQITAFYVRTKLFDSRKHRITDTEGNINSKWQKYLLDFAYQAFLIRNNWPGADIQTILVMPEKSGNAHTNNLPLLLNPFDDKHNTLSITAANQELLAKLNVTDVVHKLMENPPFAKNYLSESTLNATLRFFREVYFGGKKPNIEVGLKCKNCEFRVEQERVERGTKSGFNECWKPITNTKNPSNDHIFDLIGPGTNSRLSENTFLQTEISTSSVCSPESIEQGKGRISQEMRQTLQIHKTQDSRVPPEIIRPALFEELNRWQYPLHFLDFEAGNYAVPVRKNRRPYHLVVFQFSCHTLFSDGRWRHYEWIDDLDNDYPNFELIRQLQDVPHIEDGTIVQYSNFERHALKTISRELTDEFADIADADDLIFWLEKIISRNDSSHHQPPYMADMSRLVKNFYYNRQMESSLSIKDVLSSVMSHSSYLENIYTKPYSSSNFDEIIWWQPDDQGGTRNPYNILTETGDSPIRRGTEAMVVYGRMIAQELDADKRNAYRNALLKYCELDTLAMMMIYQHWQEVMT